MNRYHDPTYRANRLALHTKRAIAALQAGNNYTAMLPKGYMLNVRWAWGWNIPVKRFIIIIDKFDPKGTRKTKQVEADGFLMLRIELEKLI